MAGSTMSLPTASVPKLAYVGCYTSKERNGHGEGINVYQIDAATGNWTHVQLLKGVVNPSFLTFDRQKRTLYAAHGDGGEATSYRVDTATGQVETVDAQWLFVFIGAAPLTEWLDGVVVRDASGFVVAGPDLTVEGQRPRGWELDRPPYHLETSVPGVFVAGDARSESAKRVAAAVGEGAMAVMLVHRYLERL